MSYICRNIPNSELRKQQTLASDVGTYLFDHFLTKWTEMNYVRTYVILKSEVIPPFNSPLENTCIFTGLTS